LITSPWSSTKTLGLPSVSNSSITKHTLIYVVDDAYWPLFSVWTWPPPPPKPDVGKILYYTCAGVVFVLPIMIKCMTHTPQKCEITWLYMMMHRNGVVGWNMSGDLRLDMKGRGKDVTTRG
jgi:hypothetical protein